jgi:hypothetical protein
MLEPQQKQKIKASMENFFEGATQSNLSQEIISDLTVEKEKGTFQSLANKRDEDWNILCNQVVGSERL